MKIPRPILSISMLLLCFSLAHATEDLALYDGFAKRIDPDLWFGQEGTITGPGIGAEAVRRVQEGKLSMTYVGYGKTDSDDGNVPGQWALRFRDPLAVTAEKVTVNVSTLLAQGCADNFYPTYTQLRIGGNFFNASTPIPGSQVNDVVAQIAVQRGSDSPDPAGVLRIFSIVMLCLADDCAVSNQLLAYTDLGTVSVGQNVTLLLQWDADADQFVVQRDAEDPIYLQYYVSDAQPAGRAVKGLEIDPVVPNCTTTPRPTSGMSAFLDDVYVNESAAGK